MQMKSSPSRLQDEESSHVRVNKGEKCRHNQRSDLKLGACEWNMSAECKDALLKFPRHWSWLCHVHIDVAIQQLEITFLILVPINLSSVTFGHFWFYQADLLHVLVVILR